MTPCHCFSYIINKIWLHSHVVQRTILTLLKTNNIVINTNDKAERIKFKNIIREQHIGNKTLRSKLDEVKKQKYRIELLWRECDDDYHQ